MRVISSIILMLVFLFAANAQQNPIKDGGKKKTGINKPSGNPGDSNNAFKGQQQKDSVHQSQTGAEQGSGDNDPTLLGDDNDKAGPRRGDAGDNYRRNRVSGNPNNRNASEGSNRRSASGETGESITGAATDSTSVPLSSTVDNSSGDGGTVSDPQDSNVPAVTQESTSGSGSPAILSGDKGSDRDGTNNVQRAKPNMAGSPVGNLKSGKKDIDPDSEIREGTDRQQRNPPANRVKKNRSIRRTKANEYQSDQVKPGENSKIQNASEREDVGKDDANTSPAIQEEITRADKKSERKAKRKKRRNN